MLDIAWYMSAFCGRLTPRAQAVPFHGVCHCCAHSATSTGNYVCVHVYRCHADARQEEQTKKRVAACGSVLSATTRAYDTSVGSKNATEETIGAQRK